MIIQPQLTFRQRLARTTLTDWIAAFACVGIVALVVFFATLTLGDISQ